MYKNIFKNEEAFTLIELVITIAILGALVLVPLRSYVASKNISDLKTTTRDLMLNLELAKNKTLASKDSDSYGVHLEAGSYTMFKGATYSSSDINNITYTIPSNIEIANISLSSGADVVFERVSGRALNTGSFDLRVKNNTDQLRRVNVAEFGDIYIASTALVPSYFGRLEDSRHVHFAYLQDVSTATTLQLNFPGFTPTNIVFADYLNGNGTVFDWSDTISVGGEDQVLRIQTHLITPTYAYFSVNRDLRYNTKAVSLILDGQNLINYSATGTTTQGTSASVGAPDAQ